MFVRLFAYSSMSLIYVLVFLTHKLFSLNETGLANAPVLDSLPSLSNQTSTRPPTDTLISQPGWRKVIAHQASSIRGKYQGCLFGDSISQPLRTSLGRSNSNFALSGMSTVSLVVQLKLLTAANLQCTKVIIAIGTNDAFYKVQNLTLLENLKRIVALARKTGAEQIIFIPAFYASIATERDPDMADTNEQIKEVNALIENFGVIHHASVETTSTQELFMNQALKEDLTADGIHLNQDGLEKYRLSLLKLIDEK